MVALYSWTRRRVLGIGLIAGALIVTQTQPALADVDNGGFETGEFPPWVVVDQDDGSGSWFVVEDEPRLESPLSGFRIPKAPERRHQAVADQEGPGSHILYQDFVIPPGRQQLRLTLWYQNDAEEFHTPRTLDFEVEPNQQLRIDVLREGAPLDSLDPDDILAQIFRTRRGDRAELRPTEIRRNLSGLAGKQVRLRIVEVDNQSNFLVGIDAVSVGPPDGGRSGLTPTGARLPAGATAASRASTYQH